MVRRVAARRPGVVLDVAHPYLGDRPARPHGVRRGAGARRRDGPGRRRALPVAAGHPGADGASRRPARCRRSASASAASCSRWRAGERWPRGATARSSVSCRCGCARRRRRPALRRPGRHRVGGAVALGGDQPRCPSRAVWLVDGDATRTRRSGSARAAWGVQGHPEVTADIASAWAREDSPLLLAAGPRPGVAGRGGARRGARADEDVAARGDAVRGAGGRTRDGRRLTGTSVGDRDGGGRDSSSTARLARAGFAEPDKAARRARVADLAGRRRRGAGRCARADRRPRCRAACRWTQLAGRLTGPGRRCRAPSSPTRGRADRLLAVLGASPALADHLLRHPDDWRAAADAQLQPPSALRGLMLAAVRADDGDVAAGRPAGARRDGRPARRLPAGADRHRGARPHRRRPGRRRRGRARRPRRSDAWRRPSRSPGPSCRLGAPECRLAVIAMGKCGGRELNYVSDVDVVFVAEAVGDVRGDDRAPRRRRCWRRRMMRVCSASTGEGTIWPVDAALRPEGKAGPAGAHAGEPRRLLRAVGQDVGVPGAAQGPPGRRRPRARLAVRRVASRRWSGTRPGATTSSWTCRRCAAGSSRRCPPTRAAASSSSDPAACGTSSSPCSCCSSCTAAPTTGCAARTRWRRWRRCRPTATSGATTPPSWTAPTGSCARWSTACSCTGSGVRM